MAWRRPGDKPLSGTMMVHLADAYYASLGLKDLNSNLARPNIYFSYRFEVLHNASTIALHLMTFQNDCMTDEKDYG